MDPEIYYTDQAIIDTIPMKSSPTEYQRKGSISSKPTSGNYIKIYYKIA